MNISMEELKRYISACEKNNINEIEVVKEVSDEITVTIPNYRDD